jgi:hypothetical protein
MPLYDPDMLIKDLKVKIQAEINPYCGNWGEEFEAPLLSDVVEAKHFLHMRPSKWKWVRSVEHPSGDLTAYYPTKNLWRKQSYKKVCRKTPYTHEEYITENLNKEFRALFNSGWGDVRGKRCLQCNKPAEDMHHECPSFMVIFDECMKLVDMKRMLGLDWFDEKYKDSLLQMEPEAVALFNKMHTEAKLLPLCKECHRNIKSINLPT